MMLYCSPFIFFPSLSLSLSLSPGSASSSPDTMFDHRDLLKAYGSPEIKDLLSKTPLLARADLSQLDTAAKQTAFLCNVTNILYAHATMAFLASSQGEGTDTELRTLINGSVSLTTMMASRVAQATYFSRVGYYIGQLGLVR